MGILFYSLGSTLDLFIGDEGTTVRDVGGVTFVGGEQICER